MDLTATVKRQSVGTIVALIACVGTAALVIRNGLIEAGYRANPVALMAIGHDDERVRSRAMLVRLDQRKLRVSPTLGAEAIILSRIAPTSEVPWIIAGGASLQAGQVGRAINQLQLARDRNPRSRVARVYLLEAYLREMKLREAGVEIAALGRLLGKSRQVLVPVVARAMADPTIGPQLVPAIHDDPELRAAVAMAMVGLGAETRSIIAVGGMEPSSAEDVRSWRSALLNRMAESGRILDAFRLWRTFSGGAATIGRTFPSGDGLAPFAWSYLASGDGVAEPTKSGALDLSFYNRNSTVLAQRIVTLAPGSWHLNVAVEGGPSRGEEPLAATVTCIGAAAPLVRIPFAINRGGSMRASVAFAVDANCPGQRLAIVATAQEFPSLRTVSITSLELKKAQ